ncbi:MAG TPA: Gfo/Idh/MocA family oxidoreductase [Verrucomicrobiota bacterium]|nr:Gfo/Idh/MocA family oxidoreductase [Verrucomicrobiota bacterium]HNU51529.1 Gfo/Idh/MocA family oxidoreductase [Verrucomicrobiota bacterium]
MNTSLPSSSPTLGPLNRREFLRATTQSAAVLGAVAAAPWVGGAAVRGANERLGVGFIGVGGRGMSHVGTVQKLIADGELLRIVAVSDTYGHRREEAGRITGAKVYAQYRDLLADPAVDVVCIATPDRLHVPQAIDAVRAGKDVYCEKPMGHWTQTALSRQFYLETQKLQRVVQIGNQANSSPEWRMVGDYIRKGAIGRPQLVLAGFYRNGDWGERMPIPDRTALPGADLDWEGFLGDAPKVPFTVDRFFSWRKYLDYAGGPCTDLFPHVYTPFVSMLGLKYPSRAVASGGIFKYDTYDREVPDTFNQCLDYPQKLSVVLVCTLANEYQTDPCIRGDEGAIVLQTDWSSGVDRFTLIPNKGERREVAGGRSDTTRSHWKNFIECVRTRQKPVSDVEFGFQVQVALNMAMLSYLEQKVARFDTERLEIVL